jgi:hypothetical protein
MCHLLVPRSHEVLARFHFRHPHSHLLHHFCAPLIRAPFVLAEAEVQREIDLALARTDVVPVVVRNSQALARLDRAYLGDRCREKVRDKQAVRRYTRASDRPCDAP